jgi:glycosyltransferase involved in cell wall biosynthesis
MKIAILGTRGIPARYGGFETFAEQLATRLAELGHEVTVFCESDGPPGQKYKGVNLENAAVPPAGPFTTIFFDALCLWKARSSFDVVYMLGYGASLLCWIPRLWGTRVWINMDGLEWTRAKWSLIGRTYLHLMEACALFIPNRLIADARAIRNNLRQRYRYSHKTLDVIPYGCEILESPPSKALIAEWGVEERQYYVVVCRLEPENHVREIIEGHRLSGSSTPLLLVGDLSVKSKYVREILSYRDARVRFIGTIFDERLKALRYHAKAYLHGHGVGGTNPSLLEAMGCASLVMAHDNVFNREVLAGCGLFFKDAEELARLITTTESGLVQAADLRAACKRRAVQFYSWDRIVSAYNALLVPSELPVSELDYGPGDGP